MVILETHIFQQPEEAEQHLNNIMLFWVKHSLQLKVPTLCLVGWDKDLYGQAKSSGTLPRCHVNILKV